MTSQRRKIRLFVVDDHEMVRRGLRDLAAEYPDLQFVGEAERSSDALAEIELTRPDVAIIDVRMPGGSGIELCRDVLSRHPEVHCLMFTSYSDDEALVNAIIAGASGYLMKQTGGDALVGAIRAVADGRSLLDPVATQSVMGLVRSSPAQREEPQLSTQQERVLDLIVEGFTNKEIAKQLDLAEKTVKNYVSAILDKLKLRSRTQAAVYGDRRGREER